MILGSFLGMLVGLVVSAGILSFYYHWGTRRTSRMPATPRDIAPDRWIVEDLLTRHAPSMTPDRLAEMRQRMSSDRNVIRHLDGVSWHDAPAPRRHHRCWTQTWGTIDWFTDVYRCPCGGINRGDGVWFERNTRKVEA